MKPFCFRLGVLAAALLVAPAAMAADLKPGGKAPEIKVAEWVKGNAFEKFDKTDFTVVEFWATWCGPCIEAIPHITELAKKHQGKVSFYGVSVWENGEDVPAQVKSFVDGMGAKMDYNIGRDTADAHMANKWMTAAKQRGIPASFLIDKTGTVLWVGHPMDLDKVLEEATTGKFDLAASIKKFDEEAAAAAKLDAVMAEVTEAKKVYASGKKEEGLKMLAAVDAGDDVQIKMFKKTAKMEMLFGEIDALTAYLKELVAEADADNAQPLVQMAFMIKPDSSAELKALAGWSVDESVKLDPKNPVNFLMAGYGWSVLGDNKKALAMGEAGEKLLPGSKFENDENLKKAFADLKANSKG